MKSFNKAQETTNKYNTGLWDVGKYVQTAYLVVGQYPGNIKDFDSIIAKANEQKQLKDM